MLKNAKVAVSRRFEQLGLDAAFPSFRDFWTRRDARRADAVARSKGAGVAAIKTKPRNDLIDQADARAESLVVLNRIRAEIRIGFAKSACAGEVIGVGIRCARPPNRSVRPTECGDCQTG